MAETPTHRPHAQGTRVAVIVLSEDEIRAITKKVRPSAQKRVLEALGIEYKPRPDGTLIVYRFHVEPQGTRGARLPSPEPVLQP